MDSLHCLKVYIYLQYLYQETEPTQQFWHRVCSMSSYTLDSKQTNVMAPPKYPILSSPCGQDMHVPL